MRPFELKETPQIQFTRCALGTRGLYIKGLSRAQGISAGSIYSDWVFASYSLGAVATERGHPVRLSAQREQPFKVISS